MLKKIATAIARQEGWSVANSVARRNNNPGNLKLGPRARRFGAKKKDRYGHAIFPTQKDGWAAMEDLLMTKSGMSLAQIGRTYAEDPGWANKVAKIAKVDPNEKLVFVTRRGPLTKAAKFTSDPCLLVEARKTIGAKEWPGKANNPTVVRFFYEAVGQKLSDSVPWCAAWMGAICHRCGVKGSGSLMARSYLRWGLKLKYPVPGCVGIWPRGAPPSGHVGVVEKVGRSSVTIIAGNQSDAVTRANYSRAKALGWRWPKGVPLPKGAPMAEDAEPRFPDMVTEVPVVDPNKTANNAVSIVTVITGGVMLAAQWLNIDIGAGDIDLIMSAALVVVGIYMQIKNRYFTAEATLPTARKKGLKLSMKYDDDREEVF